MGEWLKDEGVKRGKCEGILKANQRGKGGFWRIVEGRIRSKVGAKRVIFANVITIIHPDSGLIRVDDKRGRKSVKCQPGRGRRCAKGGRRCPKVGQKIGLESLLDYSEGGEKAVNKGVSKVPKVKR